VSPQHCGACNNLCEGYESCVEGTCIFDDDSCGGDPTAINISRVALYQGVEVDLFKNEQWVSPEARSSDVIQGRRAMARVFVEPQAGFAQAEISARVFVDNAGEVTAFFSKMSVQGASDQANLNSTFNVSLPGEMLREESVIWVELATCGTTGTGDVGRIRVPSEGTAELAPRTTGKVRVAFIPVEHGGRVPDVTANTVAAYAQAVDRMYPTHEFEVVDIDAMLGMSAQLPSGQGSVIDLGSLLDNVTSFRKNHLDQGKITPDIYYYGLVDPASSFNAYCQGGCTTGIGWVPGATGNFSERNRAAVGIGFGTRGAGTFAHELGHNMGRNHAPCGGAGGPDQGFPYPGAKIGSWGYDLDAGTLRDPAEYVDFMGYCSPEWVSDYTYNAIAERIATVNGASANFQVGANAGATLWQRALITGSSNFWLASEYGAPSRDDQMVSGVVYDASGAVIDEFPIHRVDMSDGGGYVLYVPPARPGWYAVGQAGEWAIVY
jgi:Peptidase M66